MLKIGKCPFTGQETLKHPGLLNNKAELDLIKEKVAAHTEPWYTGYLQISDYRGWIPQAVENYCWDSTPDSASFLVKDGRAAYGCALRWILTGDASYAQNAVEILNAWSYKLKVVSVDCDTQYHVHTRLAVSGFIPPMIWAAEIIRATYSGWNQVDQDKFKQMLLTLIYPMTSFVNYQAVDTGQVNNWAVLGTEARMAIAIYTDRQDYFNEAVKDYKFLIENTVRYDGKYIETCRTGNDTTSITLNSTIGGDLEHTKLGLMAFVAMAEMGKKQGVDLYGYKDPIDGNSLLTTLLYHEPFMGYPSRIPYGNPSTWPCQVPLQNAMGVMDKDSFWEMAANHYQHPALKSIVQWAGPAKPSGWGAIGWETLTHNYFGQIKEEPMIPVQPIPYKGVPFAVPCRVEAEDFDLGGEGIAYHDLTPGNAGGQYRTNETVDIEPCAEGGFNVGYISAGEWLIYSINVVEAGKYDFVPRIASAVIGTKKMHIEIDGLDVTGPMIFTDSSGWQSWKDLKASGINLIAGNHLMKVLMDTGGLNLNYIDVKKSEGMLPTPMPTEFVMNKDASGNYGFTVNLDGAKYQVTVKKV